MQTLTIQGSRVPSPGLKSYVKRKETCRLKAYLPTPDDVPTIGWGCTGPGIKLGMAWSQARADEEFERSIGMFAYGVDRLLGTAPTTQGQFDALVSFAYNVGLDDDADTKAEGLGDSTLLKKHKAGDYLGAAREFTKWDHQAGKVLNGLTIRRAEEAAMYKAASA